MNRPITVLIVVAVFSLSAGMAIADTFEWTKDDDGDWNDGANWTRTSGTSGRTFPNDSSDVAVLRNDISQDRAVSVPTGGITVDKLEVGDADASDSFIMDGGTVSAGDPAIELFGGAVLQMDSDVSAGNFVEITGAGTLVVNGTMSANRVWNLQSTVVRIDGGKMNTNNDNLRVFGGTKLEIGNDNFTNAPNGVLIKSSASFGSYGSDRTVDRKFTIWGDDASFDGSNGLNLQITAATNLRVPNGRAKGSPTFIVDTSELTLSGSLGLSLVSSTRTFHRHPVRLTNGGTLELSGTSATGLDLVIDGNGSVLLNNASGSATGSGNNLVVGRQNHVVTSDVVLGGNGSTDSSVIVGAGGTIAPGNSIGTLTTGTMDFGAGAAYEWEFGNGSSDLLAVNGDLSIDDNFTIDLIDLAGGPFGTRDLMTYTGTFTGNPDLWTVNFSDPVGYDTIVASDGSVQITGLVPEPAGTVLIVVAGLGLLISRGKRR